MQQETELLERAKSVRLKAHAPYSHYCVGACILDEYGNVHEGCNVENAAYPVGACAETNAIGAMISAGGTKICTIAIVGGKKKLDACTPCGACRQRIAEFADNNTTIVVLNNQGQLITYSCSDLLPHSFLLSD